MFFSSALALLLHGSLALAQVDSCGQICDDFVLELDDLAICSSKDNAYIWNTTSTECQVRIDADFKIVSYMSTIFTMGVTHAVRKPIGKECWDYVPENVAKSIISNVEYFAKDIVCDSHPFNSPSLGWEARYTTETKGYNDCASIVILNNDYLASCVRLHADGRALATFAYFLAMLVGLFCFCVLPCNLAKYVFTVPNNMS